jgi:hypothetical protein
LAGGTDKAIPADEIVMTGTGLRKDRRKLIGFLTQVNYINS